MASPWNGTMWEKEERERPIAEAIAAERERCAKIAENYRPGDNIAKAIARLIRNKEQAEDVAAY